MVKVLLAEGEALLALFLQDEPEASDGHGGTA